MPLLNNSSLEQAALTTNAYGYSATRLDAPITLVGFTALSVETMTNFSTP